MKSTRSSGILLPISSLPSNGGIGTFGAEAYHFLDFLKKSGQSWWQILPLGCTSYGDSPYASFSTFAGNPYFIDPELLKQEGLLTDEEIEAADCTENPRYVAYEKLFNQRLPLLKKAYIRSKTSPEQIQFEKDNEDWLPDYCSFVSIKAHFNWHSWQEWPKKYKCRDPKALAEIKETLKDEIHFHSWLQFVFYKQWNNVKNYAHQQGIHIIGDLPIYVSADSADAWSNPKLFLFDEDLKPIDVAGCPPDYFSATGQLWGNPIYDWEYHKNTEYAWWTRRLQYAFTLYDKVRIDHFRGFAGYYCIPYGRPDAVIGEWRKGPGIELFRHFKKALGKLDIIAEDLGLLTPDVHQLLKQSGYPGMRVLQFAFDPNGDSDYLPHNFIKNCVAYPGTHDNDTFIGWYQTASRKERKFAREYLHLSRAEGYNWSMLRVLYASVADLIVVPMQDYLGLSSDCRMNTPSTIGYNWQFRMLKGENTDELANKIHVMADLYRRSLKIDFPKKSGKKENS